MAKARGHQMPGPEPKYESSAERQREYRRRNRERFRQEREDSAELIRTSSALQRAVQAAAAAGDELAARVQGREGLETLVALVVHFESLAGEETGD